MKNNEREILLITQEECAEVTQAISKVFRFGFDAVYKEESNKKRLTEELGDLHCMMELMVESGMIDRIELFEASGMKRRKLSEWSNIFSEQK